MLKDDSVLQVPRAAMSGRIGKAVQFRHVPNAVRTMLRQQATG